MLLAAVAAAATTEKGRINAAKCLISISTSFAMLSIAGSF